LAEALKRATVPLPATAATANASVPTSVAEIVGRLRHAGFVVEDRSDRGGCVWIIGGEDLEERIGAQDLGDARFTFKDRGGNASKHRPAWYWNPGRS